MSARDELHRLVDALPEDDIQRVLAFLRELPEDPVKRALALTPEDAGPLTAEEEQWVQEGRAAFQQGETVPLSQVRAELGL